MAAPISTCCSTEEPQTDNSALTHRPNPYHPPTLEEPHETWWARLKRILRVGSMRLPHGRIPVFEDGDAIICSGIAYFIDPKDRSVFYAGSPSQDHSDPRLALIADEALRYLPQFLHENPSLRSLLDDRRLEVRIVRTYDGIGSAHDRATDIASDSLVKAMSGPVPADDG